MPEITTEEVRNYLSEVQGREITLTALRKEFNILPGSKSFDGLRNILYRLAEQNIVKPTGKRDGAYKVIVSIKSVPVFSVIHERRPPYPLVFPKDIDTGFEMEFAQHIVIREGDLILISGMSNFGKTTLGLNFCAENIDQHPVLMGNEYFTLVEGEYVPSPRFLNRLDAMDWVEWVSQKGEEKFTLLPVREDYPEHIIPGRINIIDWINIDTGEHYMIGSLLEKIKRQLGRGIAIVAIQKAEGATAGRGGQFTKDFADLELLIDKFGNDGVLLTIGKVKEYTKSVAGRTYAYSIGQGVKIINFREVKRCPDCRGTGYKMGKECESCLGGKFVNKER